MCDESQKSCSASCKAIWKSPMSYLGIGAWIMSLFVDVPMICESEGNIRFAICVFLVLPIVTFCIFFCKRPHRSEEEREKANAMFPMYTFVLGIMASVVPNLFSSEKYQWIGNIRAPLGFFIIVMLCQVALLYELGVKDTMKLKRNSQLIVTVNNQNYDVEVKTKKKD